MSFIITIANVKGGSGKSTLSVQLAGHYSQHYKVMLVDTDTQQSAASFHAIRTDNPDLSPFSCATQHQPAGLSFALKEYSDKYDIIIVDTSGRDEGLARRAMVHSNLVLIPVQPSNFDVWATDHTVKSVQDCMAANPGLAARFILNNAQSKTRLEQATKKYLDEYADSGIILFPAVIHQRVEFRTSIAEGMTVYEYKKDSKATDEFLYLTRLVDKIIME